MTHFPKHILLPDAVFWDWDGTLADSYNFLNDAHNHTLKTLGFPEFKEGEFNKYFGKPRMTLYPLIYKDKCNEAMDIFQDYVLENSHKVKTISGTKAILDFFKQNNVKMGIVTNKKGSFVLKELTNTGYNSYFPTVVGAGEAVADKPSGAPLLMALKIAKIDPEQNNVWYVGDTENDMACAKDAGCSGVFLKGHMDTDTIIDEYKPSISFNNYTQLKDFLVAI